MKIKYIAGGVAAMLLFPTVAFASWWNPFTWFTNAPVPVVQNDNAALLDKINDLERKIDSMSTTTPAARPAAPKPAVKTDVPPAKTMPEPAPMVQAPVQPAVAGYSVLPSSFSKNPPYYVGSNVRVNGIVTDFLAAGDRGADANYIKIKPTSAQSNPLPYFMLNIGADGYTRASNSLSDGDAIVAYGSITASEDFTSSLGITTLIPVLMTVRIDKCDSCSEPVGSQTVFPYTPANFIPVTSITRSPGDYVGTPVTTRGKVIQIITSSAQGGSLIILGDESGDGGLVAVEVSIDFVAKNGMSAGSIVEVSGTLLGNADVTASRVYGEYQLASPNTSAYLFTDAVVTKII